MKICTEIRGALLDDKISFVDVFSIDASKTQCTSAMVNDIDKETNANCKMVKRTDNDGQPKLCLFATKYNKSGSELRYDYGVTNAPWRKQKVQYIICS